MIECLEDLPFRRTLKFFSMVLLLSSVPSIMSTIYVINFHLSSRISGFFFRLEFF